jgi:hypothetical protein
VQPDPAPFERPIVLASTPVAGAAAGQADSTLAHSTLALGGLTARRGLERMPLTRVASRPTAARVALALMLVGTFVVVSFATGRQNTLVPSSYLAYPRWESGPLHGITRYLPAGYLALSITFSVVVVAMLVAYGVVLAAIRTLSMRTIVLCIVALHAIVLMSPPQQLTDVFNYLGYARLGGLHALNPYTHVIHAEIHDPVFRFTSWHNLPSPYGPLFTAITYPLAWLSVPLSYWIVKVGTLLASLALIAIVWQCARQLGRDPRFAVAFVALNPIYVMYAMGGFHNDFFMLVPMIGSISLLLARRDRSAGAVLMLAVAVKFSALLLLPFLLVGVRRSRRRRDIALGAALGAIPLAAMSLALFGFSHPNLSGQTELLTTFSIPNLVGLAIGIGGGGPDLLRAAGIGFVLTVAYLVRRRGDWLSDAGWATVALLASLAWLMPWYVIWVLPLAAFGSSLRLRRSALALSVFLAITFIPTTPIVCGLLHINPMNTPVGQASLTHQRKLAG